MLTTAGLSRSAISTNEASVDDFARGAIVTSVRGRSAVAETAGAGVMVPATTNPTRKETVAARHTVATRNLRVMGCQYYRTGPRVPMSAWNAASSRMGTPRSR